MNFDQPRWRFPQIWGPLPGCPDNESRIVLGLYQGPCFLETQVASTLNFQMSHLHSPALKYP